MIWPFKSRYNIEDVKRRELARLMILKAERTKTDEVAARVQSAMIQMLSNNEGKNANSE